MSSTRPITTLDFDQIKSEIINYIKGNNTFSDYNFEGSALNAIIDVLAYNTHTNAFYANMLHNEGFIDTAQKRSSVVSRAKELGYTPRSATCSVSYIDIVATTPNVEFPVTIERGATFTSTNDNGSFNFIVVDDAISNVVNNTHVFNDLKIVNGTQIKNYFTVDTFTNVRSLFTIPNQRIDTSTLRVFVRDSISAVEMVEYLRAENVYELNSNSKVFFLQESYEGYFQIYFGNDVIGKQPLTNNIVAVDYFTADNGTTSDGCRKFDFSGDIGNSSSIDIVTTQISFGGSDKESLESIKYNAMKSNSAKNRSVTVSDYVLILKENFNFIETASVWGGEDNIPPVYGKVFISIQPISGYTVSDAVKNDIITPVLKSNSLLTVGIEYVDPTYLDLQFVTRIKFNNNKTTLTKFNVEILVRNSIIAYVSSISTFNKDYLQSTLISNITKLDSGISSVSIEKKLGFKLTPFLGVMSNHTKVIGNQISVGTVISNKFYTLIEGVSVLVYIKEIPDSFEQIKNIDSTITYLNGLGLYSDNILVKKIGYVNLSNGKFDMTFKVNAYDTKNRFLTIQFSLVNDNIITSRNQILHLSKSVDSSLGAFNNNTVIMENYGK